MLICKTVLMWGAGRYMDVLLTLSRGLADVGSSVPIMLTRKLLAAPGGYLLVLFSGAAGRDRRAQELAGMSEAARKVRRASTLSLHCASPLKLP